MVTIGNDTLPGTITTIDSAASIGVGLGSPANIVLVGQAYLTDGSANADQVYRLTRSRRAENLFGPPSHSLLTASVQDALVEGAYPVYAVAPSETSVTGEDLSGKSGQTGSLSNAPVQEVAGDITFTINSTEKTTVLYRDGDPANATPGTDEVYLSPQTGKYNIDESQGAAGDGVDYTYLDYTDTFDAITDAQFNNEFIRDNIDLIGTLDENDSVTSSLETKVDSMESNGWYAVGVAGAGDPYIDDAGTSSDETSSYSDSIDNSRMQLVHPSRNGSEDSDIGAYLGLRASIGLETTPIFKTVGSVDALRVNLDRTQQENLVNAQVIPLDERSNGAKVVDDITTVDPSTNTEEAAWQQGFSRLATDFVIGAVEERTNSHVGEFNDTFTLNNIRGDISSDLQSLLSSRVITGYSLVVEEIDDTTAAVDVGIDTNDPLRNAELSVVAGDVRNGVQVN